MGFVSSASLQFFALFLLVVLDSNTHDDAPLPETKKESVIDEPDDKNAALWIWIFIAITGCCWITTIIVLIKLKKKQIIERGMVINSADSDDVKLKFGDVDGDKTSNDDQNIGLDDEDTQNEEKNSELRKFMPDNDIL